MLIPLNITLPDFLTEADGEIRVTGHRITLYDLLWDYNQGLSAEEIALRFPTLKLATVHKIIGLYLDHQPQMDAFLQSYSDALQHHRNKAQPAVSVAELQRRLESIRRKALTHSSAPIS